MFVVIATGNFFVMPYNRSLVKIHALLKRLPYISWPIAGLVIVLGTGGWLLFKPRPPAVKPEPITHQVTALGRLTPEGGLVSLSVPAGSGAASNDVVEGWFVKEGDNIRAGEVLVQMKSFQQLKADLAQAEASLEETKRNLPFLEAEQKRALNLLRAGAVTEQAASRAITDTDTRLANIKAAKAAAEKAKIQLSNTRITSPLNGTLIRIYSWPGMRETDDGLAVIGRTNKMQAWAQVFQSDIRKLRIGQAATISPESGGFQGSLKGRLQAIVSNVSGRDIFAVNSNNDVNARVILVKLSIDAVDIKKVKRLSGLNVIVRFDP